MKYKITRFLFIFFPLLNIDGINDSLFYLISNSRFSICIYDALNSFVFPYRNETKKKRDVTLGDANAYANKITVPLRRSRTESEYLDLI